MEWQRREDEREDEEQSAEEIAKHDLQIGKWRREEDVPGARIRFLDDRAGHEDRCQKHDERDLPERDDRECVCPPLRELPHGGVRAEQVQEKHRDHDREEASAHIEVARPPRATSNDADADRIGGEEPREPENDRRHA